MLANKKTLLPFSSKPLWIGIGIYVVIFGLISLWKYFNFAYNSLDLAILNNVLYQTSLGQLFGSSIHPPSYLGDHFNPIILLLLLPYLIFSTPQTLLLLQTLTLGLTAWPVYLICQHLFEHSKTLDQSKVPRLSLIIAMAWLFNPFLHNINLFEFHLLSFAILPLLFSGLFYLKRSYWPFIIMLGLALLVREDVALVVVGFGLLALLDRRKLKWWLIPLLGASLYFLLAMQIIDMFAVNSYKFSLYYSWLGNSLPAMLINLIKHPFQVLLHILRGRNVEFTLGLLLPFALLPLLKPRYLILSLLVFAQIIFQVSGGTATHLAAHYTSLLLPGLLLASIAAIPAVVALKAKKSMVITLLQKEKPLRWIVITSIVLYTSLALGPLPGVVKTIASQGLISHQAKIQSRALEIIPDNAAVAATYAALPHLSSRQQVYSFNYAFLNSLQYLQRSYQLPANTQFLVIDFDQIIGYELQYGNNPFYAAHYQKTAGNLSNILNDFGLISIQDNVAVFQRGAKDKDSEDLITVVQPPVALNQSTATAGKIKLLAHSNNLDTFSFLWQAAEPITTDYRFRLLVRNDKGLQYQKLYPLGYGILPTSQWQPNQVIQTNFWFDLPNKLPAGQYQLALQVLTIDRGGIEINNIRSTTQIIDQVTLLGEEIDLGSITL